MVLTHITSLVADCKEAKASDVVTKMKARFYMSEPE